MSRCDALKREKFVVPASAGTTNAFPRSSGKRRKHAEENSLQRLIPARAGKAVNMRRVVMEAIYQCVGGLDVHQKVIVARRRRLIGEGKVESEVEKFGTSTRELKRLWR